MKPQFKTLSIARGMRRGLGSTSLAFGVLALGLLALSGTGHAMPVLALADAGAGDARPQVGRSIAAFPGAVGINGLNEVSLPVEKIGYRGYGYGGRSYGYGGRGYGYGGLGYGYGGRSYGYGGRSYGYGGLGYGYGGRSYGYGGRSYGYGGRGYGYGGYGY